MSKPELNQVVDRNVEAFRNLLVATGNLAETSAKLVSMCASVARNPLVDPLVASNFGRITVLLQVLSIELQRSQYDFSARMSELDGMGGKYLKGPKAFKP